MANIKTTPAEWEKAKEYYEAGLLLREISHKTKIAIPSISKKAAKDGWSKANEKKILIQAAVDVEIAKANLSEVGLKVHDEVVNQRIKHLLFFDTAQGNLAKIAMAKIAQTLDDKGKPTGATLLDDVNKASNIVSTSRTGILGKAPDTAIQINNSNLETQYESSYLKRLQQDFEQ